MGQPVGASRLTEVLRSWRRNQAATAPRPERLSLLLFAVTAFVYLLSGRTFFGYDGEMMYRVSESIVLRHSIQIVDPIYHTNQPYAGYAIGLSLLMMPLVAMGAVLFHDPRLLVTLLEPTVTALTVVALNLLLVELGCSWRRSVAIAMAYAFGTLAWHYSGILFTEPVIGLCLVAAVLGIVRHRRSGGTGWLVMAGTAAGVSVLLRWDSILTVAGPVGLCALWVVGRTSAPLRSRILKLAAFGAPVAIAVGIALAYDALRFGQPLGGPYSADPLGFSTPLLKGLFGLLLSPGVGLFVYTPVLLMSILGFPRFVRQWRVEGALILALFAVRVVFFARYWAWDGGATWGPRFLVPLIPLLLVPLAFLPRDRRIEIATIALAAVGVAIQLLGQLVPYGLYYGTVVPQLTTQLGLCHGCLPFPGPQGEAVSNITDFDWRYAPLVVQVKYLLQGITAPPWGEIAFAIPLLLGLVGYGLFRVQQLAVGLDVAAKEKGRPAGRPLRRSSSG
jgi:hypothetical protein